MSFNLHQYLESRADQRQYFLAQAGLEGARFESAGKKDCSTRRYVRVVRGDATAILMESVPDDHPYASPGHKVKDFLRLGRFFMKNGVRTPDIFADNASQGYVLLEDFGDVSVRDKFLQGLDYKYYLKALSAAVDINKIKSNEISLPAYYASHVHQSHRRVVDWYMPFVRGQKNDDGAADSYLDVWQQIESRLPPCLQTVLHIDFHPDNLMWLDKRKQCGVLDYQGAMRGPMPYDIANLLEDARFYMPKDQRDFMRGLYCSLMKIEGEEKENFDLWYRVLATQFHCRVIGQFIKIALTSGQGHYLGHIPVLSRYLQEGLGHPILWPLRKWFKDMNVPFDSDFKPDLMLADKIVATQAF